ncbi:MAG: tRNA pseudouridine65 synthase [Saprospiraceae bacterium]
MIPIDKNSKLDILYQDEYLVAINKPCGYLVHRSPIARDAEFIVLQILRDQVGQHVYPIHRIDRKTSGVLLFALDTVTNRGLGKDFAEHNLTKEYTAVVRGWIDDNGVIDYALTNDSGKTQDAITKYECLDRFELDLPLGRFQTSRYSHVKVLPKTGRMHQIRKHMNHLRHPIVGDRPHGCSKQNRLWKSEFGLTNMMLHAKSLDITHPITKTNLSIEAPYFSEYERVLGILSKEMISD